MQSSDKMNSFHEFEGSKARIEKDGKNFVAKCECGWSSDPASSGEGAVVEFEKHVKFDPNTRSEKRRVAKVSEVYFWAYCSLAMQCPPVSSRTV
ncbi:hypothetical protein AKJ64_03935 [candidate division MSBL1 archaeon SCGC-AAA259E17]|uniref:Uncharacterized protein n=1 Tax=candidate division MSBL1 archaeon SCGC-AAA259E17 TaxID=1698263 RepID=A0A133UD52_9EURY|nr:hypothetical protein AKJ64_03935 [candidate division MSBL1 archaeon SCGC-AAA259E17]